MSDDPREKTSGTTGNGKPVAQMREVVARVRKEEDDTPRQTILVVDDVLVMRLRLRAQLEESGFNVIDAESGERALELLEKNAEVRIIVTDINMPGIDGLEFIRRLKKLPKLSLIPVVICTAKGEFTIVRQAKQLGVQGFLVKPIAKPTLLAVIRRELE